MIISNQQIAVHLGTLRNLTSYTSGRYALRLCLSERSHKTINKATPVGIIQKQHSQCEGRSEFDEEHFLTQIFSLKSAANVQIDEIYIFKLDSPLTSNRDEDNLLSLTIELIHVEGTRQRVVGIYKSAINPQAQHEYLEVDFYQNAPCQIIGSFHRCCYKLQFKADGFTLDLKQFCQKYYRHRVDDMLEFLQLQTNKNYRSLAQYSSLLLKEEIQIDCIELEESVLGKIIESHIDVWEGETQIGSPEEQLSFDTKTGGRKKRQRIFSVTKDYISEKYQTHETKIHQNAQKTYSLWRDLLHNLFSETAAVYFREKACQYHKKLVQKTKESVSSFKGCWDTDMYGQETSLRTKLANQLRNQNNEFYKELNPSIHSEFPIMNESFFTNQRPIFFEEKAVRPSFNEEPLLSEILVILVHGLGACRMDMERIKIELKRYYQSKVKIFISSTNEGRTEGDIEAMGMRLASQVDYQLNKYNQYPKICFLGHSMGGLIIRSALPRLQKYKRHFHSLITLSSPHLGYSYSDSKLIDAGLWFMNTVKKCTSILQMTMNDSQKIEQTFLYRLSQKPGIQWFKKIVFLGSHQDHYVPYYSARIQKHEESLLHERSNVKKGKVHCEMVDNILARGKGCVIRLDINFCNSEQNIDSFIGRAAHINFINNTEMIRALVLAGKHYFF